MPVQLGFSTAKKMLSACQPEALVVVLAALKLVGFHILRFVISKDDTGQPRSAASMGLRRFAARFVDRLDPGRQSHGIVNVAIADLIRPTAPVPSPLITRITTSSPLLSC